MQQRGNTNKGGCLNSPLLWIPVAIAVIWFLLVNGHENSQRATNLINGVGTQQRSESNPLSGLTKGLSSFLGGNSAAHPSAACQAYANTYSSANAKQYAPEACQDAINAGIDPRIFVRQMYQESGFDPRAGSSTGDIGIAQFQRSTAAGMGVDPNDPHSALKGAATLMAGHLHNNGGNMAKALSAYNAEQSTVDSAVRRGGANWQAYLPRVTQNYIRIIMG